MEEIFATLGVELFSRIFDELGEVTFGEEILLTEESLLTADTLSSVAVMVVELSLTGDSCFWARSFWVSGTLDSGDFLSCITISRFEDSVLEAAGVSVVLEASLCPFESVDAAFAIFSINSTWT